jgi:HlyD family secretion protein
MSPRSFLIPLLIALGAASPALAAEAAPAGPVNTLAIPAVSVATAEPRELVETLTVSGTLIPRDELLVPAEIEGLRVTELLVDEGDTVEKGQILARLSRETLDAQLAQNDASIRRAEAAIAQTQNQIPQAEAALTEAQAALQRTEALRQSGNATQELYDQRLAAARTATARLAAARDGLVVAQADRSAADAQRRELLVRVARTEIKAPAAGLVSRRTAKVGSVTSLVGDPLFRIIKDGKVELEAEALDTHLPRMSVGSPAVVILPDGHKINGTVRLLPAEVDRTTRVGKVRIALPVDPGLRIGGFARATVEIARHHGVAVPSSAVAFGETSTSIQVVKGDKVELRTVKVGISAGGYTEITEGLADGEVVVAKAMAFLRDGDVVRALPAATSARTQ